MSFTKLNAEELSKIAEFFAVEVVTTNPEGIGTKKELLAALASGDEPVTWEQYQEVYLPALGDFKEPEDIEPVALVAKPVAPLPTEVPTDVRTVVVRMNRPNPYFEIRGHQFTQEHPYAIMKEDDAAYVTRQVEGFSVALPSEVDEYYA